MPYIEIKSTNFSEIAEQLKQHAPNGAHFTNGTLAYPPQQIIPLMLCGFHHMQQGYGELPFVIAVNSETSMRELNCQDERSASQRAASIVNALGIQFPQQTIIVIQYDQKTPAELYQHLAQSGLTKSLHKWGYGLGQNTPCIIGAEYFDNVVGFVPPAKYKPVAHAMTPLQENSEPRSQTEAANELITDNFLVKFNLREGLQHFQYPGLRQQNAKYLSAFATYHDEKTSQSRDFSQLLTTESPNPLTKNLAEVSKADAKQAIASCFVVDKHALNDLQIAELSKAVESLTADIWQRLHTGHKVIIAGCGASGRLAMSICKYFRVAYPQYADKVLDVISGGDAALVSSIPRFEDDRGLGVKQLQALDFSADDMLITTTASGDAPFIQAMVEHAVRHSKVKPWFVCCNPTEQIITRNPQHILVAEQGKINTLVLNVGSPGVSGSTRMQPSTAMLLAIGRAALGNSSCASSAEKLYNKLNNLSEQQLRGLAELACQESASYLAGHKVFYTCPDEYAMCVFTDITERSPTFNLAAIKRSSENPESHALAYLWLDVDDAEAAWQSILGRSVRALNWQDWPQTRADHILDYDFSKQGKATREGYLENTTHDQFTLQMDKQTLVFSYNGKVYFSMDCAGLDELEIEVLVKMLLNTHSTVVMGRCGYYQNNLMRNVQPGNAKLIGRSISYIHSMMAMIFNDLGSYHSSYWMQILRLNVGESIVNKTVEGLLSRHYEYSAAVDALVDPEFELSNKPAQNTFYPRSADALLLGQSQSKPAMRYTKSSLFIHKHTPVIDAHAHLFGSLSLSYLQRVAARNNKLAHYESFIKLKQEYQQRIAAGEIHSRSALSLIWRQFAEIKAMVITLADVTEAVVDAAENSNADILELRSTPKCMQKAPRSDANGTLEDYIAAFIAGLEKANNSAKQVRGLLSIDRVTFTEEVAKQMIDAVAQQKQAKSSMLTGVDICGDPTQPRVITGETLRRTLRYALTNKVPIAIHCAETKSDIDADDVKIILEELIAYKQSHLPAQPSRAQEQQFFYGIIRLSHGIYLNAEAKALIKKHNIPMDGAPTCAASLNWKLPFASIFENYPLNSVPALPGTDDAGIFTSNGAPCNARDEANKLYEHLHEIYVDGNDEELAALQQSLLF